MNKQQAVEHFEEYNMASVKRLYERDGIPDYPARSEEWNNYTDFLCKEGEITSEQYDDWTHPDCCIALWEKEALNG